MPTTGKRSKTSYLYAIIGVSLVLFFLGVIGWVVINGRALTRNLQENILITAEFHDNTRPENIDRFNAMLKQQTFIKASTVRYISKDEAQRSYSASEGRDNAALLGYNPLGATTEFNVYSEYVNDDSLKKITTFIQQSNIVRDVMYEHKNVQNINYNLRKINIILGVIALLLFIVVIILIDNTVRLAMFSNRFLIKTMQMVGATRFFISRPFDRRAIINGLISGVVAIAGLFVIIYFAEKYFPELQVIHDTTAIAILMAGLLLMGILICLISTHRSVVKYLKMPVDDLY